MVGDRCIRTPSFHAPAKAGAPWVPFVRDRGVPGCARTKTGSSPLPGGGVAEEEARRILRQNARSLRPGNPFPRATLAVTPLPPGRSSPHSPLPLWGRRLEHPRFRCGLGRACWRASPFFGRERKEAIRHRPEAWRLAAASGARPLRKGKRPHRGLAGTAFLVGLSTQEPGVEALPRGGGERCDGLARRGLNQLRALPRSPPSR